MWALAPLLLAGRRDVASRIGGAMAAGVLLPLVLGIANVLYGWTLWLATGILLVYRYSPARRKKEAHDEMHPAMTWDVVAAFGVIAALSWRGFVSHDVAHVSPDLLANAVDWATNHGIWTTGSAHWWYLPAPDLFASGLIATGGLQLVTLTGLLPAASIVLTLRAASDRYIGKPEAGTIVACALLATPVASAQIASVSGDLWIAALFISTLNDFHLATMGTLALVSPNGLVYALISTFTWIRSRHEFAEYACVTIAAALLWAFRDFVLTFNAAGGASGAIIATIAGTNIAVAPLAAMEQIVSISVRAGWAWCAFFFLGIATIVAGHNAYLRTAALAATLVFLTTRFGYEPSALHQSHVSSLAYALPLAALGALLLANIGPRQTPFILVVASIATLWGVVALWIQSSGEPDARWAPLVAGLAALLAFFIARLPHATMRHGLAGAALVVFATAAASVKG